MPVIRDKSGQEIYVESLEPGQQGTTNTVDIFGLGASESTDQALETLGTGGSLESLATGGQRAFEQDRNEQYGGFGGGLKALGAGLARGATFGLSDVLLDDVGAGEDLKLLKDENPGTSLVGEIGGAFVPGSPAAGVLGATGRLGKSLGGLKGAAAGAALEGAAFGAGQGLSNAVLKDIPLASEAALAEIGLSAVLGAGGGAVLGAGVHGAGKLSDLLTSNAAARREATKLSPLHPDSPEGQAVLSNIALRTREASDAADGLLRAADQLPVQQPKVGHTLTEQVRVGDTDLVFEAARRHRFDNPFHSPESVGEPALNPDDFLDSYGRQLTRVRAVRKLNDGTHTDAGFAEFTVGTDGKLTPTDVGVWVDPAFQRKGVATRLYDMARKVSNDAEVLPGKQQTEQGKAFSEAFRRRQPTGVSPLYTKAVAAPEGEFMTQMAAKDLGPIKDIEGRILQDIDPATLSKPRVDRIRKGFEEGTLPGKDPEYGAIRLSVDSDGALEVIDGRHRFITLLHEAPDTPYPFRIAQGRKIETFKQNRAQSPMEKFLVDEAEIAAREAEIAAKAPILQAVQDATAARKAFQKAIGSKDDVMSPKVVKKLASMDAGEVQHVLGKWTAYRKAMDMVANNHPEAAANYKAAADAAVAEVSNLGKLSNANGLSGADLAKQLGLTLAATQVADFDGPADDVLKAILVHKYLRGGGNAVTAGSHPRGFAGKLASSTAGWMGFRGGSEAAQAVGVGGLGRFLVGKQARDGVRSMLNGGSGLAASVGKALTRTEEATAQMLKGVSKVGKKAAPGAAAILNNARFGTFDSESDSKDSLQMAFKKRSDEIANLAANPMAAQQKAYEALSGVRAVHPLVADAMEMKVVEAAQFLYEKMPKDPGSMTSFGRSKWKPDESAIYQWAQYVKAIENPLGVAEDAAAGTVTVQGAEVLRKVFPRLFQEVQVRLAEHPEELEKNTTGDQRLKLSILFGMQVDSFYGPSMSKFMQEQWIARSEQNQPMNIKASNKPEQPTAAQRLLDH